MERNETKAVERVMALHSPERRYVEYVGAKRTFDSAMDALRACRNNSLEGYEVPYHRGATNIPFFIVCSHCKKFEEEGGFEWESDTDGKYPLSTWPCATMKAINGEEEV